MGVGGDTWNQSPHYPADMRDHCNAKGPRRYSECGSYFISWLLPTHFVSFHAAQKKRKQESSSPKKMKKFDYNDHPPNKDWCDFIRFSLKSKRFWLTYSNTKLLERRKNTKEFWKVRILDSLILKTNLWNKYKQHIMTFYNLKSLLTYIIIFYKLI